MGKLKVFRVWEDSELKNLRFLDQHHSLPFILERDDFIFTGVMSESDIIVVLSDMADGHKQYEEIKKHYKNQLILILHIFHSEENFSSKRMFDFYKKIFTDLTDKIQIVHTEIGYSEGIYYDWLWNRQKLLFTDYDNYHVGDYNYMDRASKKMYELSEIKRKSWGTRKFICMNRTRQGDYTDRNVRRVFLRDYLKDHDGYYNDPENNIKFLSQESVPYYTHDRRGVTTDYKMDVGFGKVHPIHDLYYENTIFSVYVETLTYFGPEKMRTVTEKTWNPLIKGHYILPFGYCGLIKDIKEYGFLLPDWIDYSYDLIESDSIRFIKYIESINKLLMMSNQDLVTLSDNGLDILNYNRNLFFKKGYSKLLPSVKEFL